jgi:hypothetical protein
MISKKELLERVLFLLSVVTLSITLATLIFIGLLKW